MRLLKEYDWREARPWRRDAQRLLEESISDALVKKGFLKSGDVATVDLGRVEGDQCTVIIRKGSDTSMEVGIEDASGGVGSATATSSRSDESHRNKSTFVKVLMHCASNSWMHGIIKVGLGCTLRNSRVLISLVSCKRVSSMRGTFILFLVENILMSSTTTIWT